MAMTLRNTDILFNDGTAQSTALSTTSVLNATAAASVGAVGTYAMLRPDASVTLNPGNTRAGSALLYASAGGMSTTSTIPSGTWRLMGYCLANALAPQSFTSVWLRIS